MGLPLAKGVSSPKAKWSRHATLRSSTSRSRGPTSAVKINWTERAPASPRDVSCARDRPDVRDRRDRARYRESRTSRAPGAAGHGAVLLRGPAGLGFVVRTSGDPMRALSVRRSRPSIAMWPGRARSVRRPDPAVSSTRASALQPARDLCGVRCRPGGVRRLRRARLHGLATDPRDSDPDGARRSPRPRDEDDPPGRPAAGRNRAAARRGRQRRDEPAACQSAVEHVAARSPTLLTVTSVIVTIGLLACWIPARRAVRVEPMVALRQDPTGSASSSSQRPNPERCLPLVLRAVSESYGAPTNARPLGTTTGRASTRRADVCRDMSWWTVHERRRFRRRATSERRRT